MSAMSILKGTKVEISQELLDEAYAIGKQRHIYNRSRHIQDQQRTGASWYQVDGEGVCGEMAFAQLIDAPNSEWEKIRTVSAKSVANKSDFGDCVYLGKSIDVKTTKYEFGNLIIVNSKLTNLADAYALMTGFRGVYNFRGVILKDTIIKRLHEFEHHHTNSVWIDQKFLTHLPKLT